MKTNALLDTGASISCISLTYFKKVGCTETDLNVSSVTHIVGVGGETHPVLGTANLSVRIGNVLFDHKFYVFSKLHHTLILGTDFMSTNKAHINFHQHTVSFNEGLIHVALVESNHGLARSLKSCKLAPHQECNIPVVLSRVNPKGLYLLEPIVRTYSEIVSAKCLVSAHGKKAAIRVVNISNQDVFIPRNKVLATVSYVDNTDIHTLADTNSTNQNPSVNVASTSQVRDVNDITFDLDNADLTENQKNELLQFLKTQRDVFANDWTELGKTNLHYHEIETEDAPPVRMPFYRQSIPVKKQCSQQIKEMLDANIIHPSDSPWHSPVVMVKKKDGSYRFAVDYRKLNAITKPMFYPLQRFDDVIDSVGESQAQLFSVLDCASGFWQIPLHPKTKHKSAFITQEGVFEFNRLPFGLKNAPMAFQSTMAKALNAMNWKYVLIYIDDIIIYSQTFSDHLKHLKAVFGKLKEAGLTLKPSKCRFAAKEVTYLGHIFSKDGIHVDPDKIEAVKSFPEPNSQHQVRQFLGLANYYRKFVPNYSKIAVPLTKLLQKETKFEWSTTCQTAFDKLKAALISAPILVYPNFDKPFLLTTDASGEALGYILGQLNDNGHEQVIAYGGRSLHPNEKKWSVTEQECLAILEGIRTFRPYLAHGPFSIYTDHGALEYLKTFKYNSGTGRLARWALTLQEYDYQVFHRPGKKNLNADALSRRSYPRQTTSSDPENIPCLAAAFSGSTSINDNSEYLEVTFSYTDKQPCVTSVTLPDVISVPDVCKRQREDEEYKPIFDYLENHVIPPDYTDSQQKGLVGRAMEYGIVNGTLHHFYHPKHRGTKSNRPNAITQLAVPKPDRKALLTAYHDSVIGGCHLGRDSTRQAIQQKYHWPRMYQDIEDYIKTCDICQRCKTQQHATIAPMVPMPIEDTFQRLHVDILGPLPQTASGNKYILLAIDSFTRWTESFPMKTMEAREVADLLVKEVFTRYGAPRTLLTDRGRQFTSKLVNAICEIYSVKHHYTSAYHPQTNGVCERRNKDIAQILRSYCNEEQTNWDELLPFVMMAIRSSPCQSTGFSPHYMLFGREMLLPIDTTIIPKDSLGKEATSHINGLLKHLKLTKEVAEENIRSSQETTKSRYDQKASPSKFAIGDTVLLRNTAVPKGHSPKLMMKYNGPYSIEEIGPNYTYKLRNCENYQIIKPFVNHNRLKMYNRRQPTIVDLPQKHDQADKQDDPQDNTNAKDLKSQNNSDQSRKDDEKLYDFDKIIKRRRQKGKTQYLLKWVNAKPTWEPSENISEKYLENFNQNYTANGCKKRKRKTFFK